MSETKNTAKPAAASTTAGKFTKPATEQDAKRALATRRMIVCFIVCLALWVGIFTAQATGDMSTRLALGLAAVVLAAGSFYAGTWKQYMWPEEV